MKTRKSIICHLAGLLATVCAPAHAAVAILSTQPTLSSPQVLGTTINWVVKATDSNTGPLTFQFKVAAPGGSLVLARDFNVGTLSNGTWTSPAFAWTTLASCWKARCRRRFWRLPSREASSSSVVSSSRAGCG